MKPTLNQLLLALRAAGESTRLRILAALKHSELTVSELTMVLDQSQPRVSRHLKLLCDSGLLERYQEGAWVFHRISDREGVGEVSRGLLELINLSDAELERDQQKLREIRQEKTRLAATYFSQHAAEWDSIRERMVSDADVERKLIERVCDREIDLFLDLGTGTGRILEILAPYVRKGIGYDLSREMLNVARSNLENAGVSNCTVRRSDIHSIGLNDNCADVITIHQVLHYCDNPEQVVRESGRLLKPGGQLLIVDFLPHDLEFLRERHAHQRLGFAKSTLKQWCRQYGFGHIKHESLEARHSANFDQTLTVGLWSAELMHNS
ncbi:MAG: ArsR/SmtB family transcription factor [bacterium]